MGSHRLPDEHRALHRDELLEHCDDVSDEGIARQVIGKLCTRTVPPLVHEQHPISRQRLRRWQQLARAPRETVQQYDDGAVATEVSDRDRDTVGT